MSVPSPAVTPVHIVCSDILTLHLEPRSTHMEEVASEDSLRMEAQIYLADRCGLKVWVGDQVY